MSRISLEKVQALAEKLGEEVIDEDSDALGDLFNLIEALHTKLEELNARVSALERP